MKRRMGQLLLVVMAGALAVVLVASTWGRGGRGYFSPDTLEARSQSQWLVPIVDLPIFRGRSTTESYPLIDFLVAQGYWTPVNKAEPTWIPMYHWNRQWRDGESSLYRELCYRGNEWMEWTKDNPERAAVVWPRVLATLRSNNAHASVEAAEFMRWGRDSPTTKHFEMMIEDETSPSKRN